MHDPVPRAINRTNLTLISRELIRANIEHFICYGTLLGFVREGNIIDGDDDIDISIYDKHFGKALQVLSNCGFKVTKNIKSTFLQGSRVVRGINTYVDFYFYTKSGNNIFDKWNFHGKYKDKSQHLKIPMGMVFPTVLTQFDDITISMPGKSEMFCGYLYGPRFREPMSKVRKDYEVSMVRNRPRIKYNIPEADWNRIYRTKDIADTPSSFAQFVAEHIESDGTLVDIGCGNARDTVFFSSRGLTVTGIDGSATVISKNRIKYPSINFIQLDVSRFSTLAISPDYVYMRFFIHSIPKTICSSLLRAVYAKLGSLLFIECRSVRDPMYGKGKKGKLADEFINDHYRRFIRIRELVAELEQIGFTIIYQNEEGGLSPTPGDNPVLIRVIACK